MANDLSGVVDAVSFAMSVQDLRAKVAAANIATTNVPNSQYLRFDVLEPQTAMQEAATNPVLLADTIADYRARGLDSLVHSQSRMGAADSLDEQVTEMNAASGRYQALADAISREFALMQIAVRGGR